MSLRDKLLSMLTKEKASDAHALTVREDPPAEGKLNAEKDEPEPGNDGKIDACPKCSSTLLVAITQGIRRCQQCGHQQPIEPKRTIAAPPIVKPRATAPSECPSCGSSAPLQPIGGGGLRCQACGHQTDVEHSYGLSRKDIATYDGPPAHAQMNGPSFYQALARMRSGH